MDSLRRVRSTTESKIKLQVVHVWRSSPLPFLQGCMASGLSLYNRVEIPPTAPLAYLFLFCSVLAKESLVL